MICAETISLLLNVTGSAKLLQVQNQAEASGSINANSAAKTVSKAGDRMVTGAACIPDPEKVRESSIYFTHSIYIYFSVF